MFTEALLVEVGGQPFDEVILLDGNDPAGSSSACSSASHGGSARSARTSSTPTPKASCSPATAASITSPNTDTGARLVVVANHLKSRGYGDITDPIGAKRRQRQAARIKAIYQDLRAEGLDSIAIIGDLNDSPTGGSLTELLDHIDLRDISEHPAFEFGERTGTFGTGNEEDKIDYILLSPGLFTKVTGGGVFRKGVWHGPRVTNPWLMYPTLIAEFHAASDHAAIYAEIDL